MRQIDHFIVDRSGSAGAGRKHQVWNPSTGEVQAEVASAHALTDDQLADLEGKLRAREGRTVKLKSRVDPDLLGGLVVTIGSKRIDSSIRTRLNSLAQAMKTA